MDHKLALWDYLIVTASNEAQAAAYNAQLETRRRLGFLSRAREVLVVADTQGKRVGSGGSTLYCLLRVLNRETSAARKWKSRRVSAETILQSKRILILHAGGDSRRLPAYCPCGKLFVPVPGQEDAALPTTLFDLLLPALIKLPAGIEGAGQVVVTSGDALLLFDPSAVSLAHPGMTAIACPAGPVEASKHGVFCAERGGEVRLYLQKPSPRDQKCFGAIGRDGQAWLDTGIMSFDATIAAALLRATGIKSDAHGRFRWYPASERRVSSLGLDFYREICCAMGKAATEKHHRREARAAGSRWSDAALSGIRRSLAGLPFYVERASDARFLHFGTTRQLIASGLELLRAGARGKTARARLILNVEIKERGKIHGRNVWVEGCRVSAPMQLAGNNVVVGVDVAFPLTLPARACLDVLRGRRRDGKAAWFVRCYGIDDSFKDALNRGATYCGRPLEEWIAQAGLQARDVWDDNIHPAQRSLWNAKVFPAATRHEGYRDWLWMFNPAAATAEQKSALRFADRYSAAEILERADQRAFFDRRERLRAEATASKLPKLLRSGGEFSAKELAWVLSKSPRPLDNLTELLNEAGAGLEPQSAGGGLESLRFSRLIHTLGSAVEELAADPRGGLSPQALPRLQRSLAPSLQLRLRAAGLPAGRGASSADWARKAREAAFTRLHATILHAARQQTELPRNVLRRDETVWGRAPARLELGGGWTDTPPYTLEYGGEVVNAAINLNGQPPIHCYSRVIPEPVIRLHSIDAGMRVEIRELDELADFRKPEDNFALVKGALHMAGFSRETASAARARSLRHLLQNFGGGIELTTLVGIPKGSGLGTSSILGAVIISVVHRMMGRALAARKLFHEVLRLEQALTTGGGWQDQIGGAVGGGKITVTQPGLIPNPRIRFLPSDILDPKENGGLTLLYYTGLTRLAKNILQRVVGGYLNRERSTMSALADEHEVARCIAEAMERKDAPAFGHYFDVAWRLHRQLCPDVSNPQIESLLARLRPYIHGARLLGAGSGGFMLMVCKTQADAGRVKRMLETHPLNDNSRFFDFEINRVGLEVTAC